MKKPFVLALLLVSGTFSAAQVEITLKQNFIQTYADRVTIDTDFRVDVTSKIHYSARTTFPFPTAISISGAPSAQMLCMTITKFCRMARLEIAIEHIDIGQVVMQDLSAMRWDLIRTAGHAAGRSKK